MEELIDLSTKVMELMAKDFKLLLEKEIIISDSTQVWDDDIIPISIEVASPNNKQLTIFRFNRKYMVLIMEVTPSSVKETAVFQFDFRSKNARMIMRSTYYLNDKYKNILTRCDRDKEYWIKIIQYMENVLLQLKLKYS